MSAGTIHIVDDDAAVREALEMLFKFEGFRTKSYSSGQAFLKRTPLGCGCILLDMRLGDMTGHDVLGVLEKRGNTLPVVILTAHGDIPSTVLAIRGGAIDYLTKSDDPDVLLSRVRQLMTDVPPQVHHSEGAGFVAKLNSLTPREREIFKLARQGLDTQTIATRLSVSPRTVEAHRSHIAKKFGAASLAEVFRMAADELPH